MLNDLKSVDQVTPEWLSKVLEQNDQWTNGAITELEISNSYETNPSYMAQLRAKGAQSDQTFVFHLKIGKPERIALMEKETRLYRSVFEFANVMPLPHCYGYSYNPNSKNSWLLLEDLSDSHFNLPWPLPTTKKQTEVVVGALANLHGAFWGDNSTAAVPSEEELEFKSDDEISGFIEILKGRLSRKRIGIIDKISSAYPELIMNRIQNKSSLTLCHGDVHTGNILVPRNENDNTVYLIDWQTYSKWIGASDVSRIISGFWYPDQRHKMELEMLHRYFELLTQHHNVQNYNWNHFWYDYRLSIVGHLYQVIGIPADFASIWWSPFEQLFCAFEDLNCEELLG